MSLRHAGMCFALAVLLLPWSAEAQKRKQKPAQNETLECTEENAPCANGGPCPLRNLPYEEFIAAPPTIRPGREVPPVADRPFDPESGPRMRVKGFVVDGVTPNPALGVTPETAQAAANAAFARETNGAPEARMTVGHMVKVSDEVTNFLRSKGYLLAKAFLPVQTIGPDSIVHIQVSEGKISDVVVEGAKHYSPSVLRKPAERLIGTVPTRDEVETALLYTQDYPGVRLFGTFKPGANLGETKLVLQVQDETRFGFGAGADNYGTQFTGEYRGRIDASWRNPIGFGDNLDVSVLQSVHPTNTTYGSVNYDVPIGLLRGFKVTSSASRNAFVVNRAPFNLLTLEGVINQYQLGTDWRVDRGRFANSGFALSYLYKESKLNGVVTTVTTTTLPIARDKLGVLELQSSLDRIDLRFKGVDQLVGIVRQGVNGDFGAASTLNKHFTIFEGRYTRVQSLAETQTGILRLRGQTSYKPLSPLEQFALAGPDVVRAYPVGEALRDNGQFASLEYQVQAPGFARSAGPFGRQWGDLLQLSLFGDYAHGRGAKEKGREPQDGIELAGYGAGIHFGIPGSFTFVLEGSEPLSSRKAGDGRDFRLYGNLSWKF